MNLSERNLLSIWPDAGLQTQRLNEFTGFVRFLRRNGNSDLFLTGKRRLTWLEEMKLVLKSFKSH